MKTFWIFLALTVAVSNLVFKPVTGQRIYPKLQDYCIAVEKEFDKIPGERKEVLLELVEYILEAGSKHPSTQLLFVCKHNSRRSQFAQIWAHTAANYYKLKNIKTYSGGMDFTAINFRILESLKRAGFSVTAAEIYSQNPVYLVSIGKRYPDLFIYSKKYDYWNNPNDNYATILCSKKLIDSGTHFPGTEKVLALPYENVEIFDNSSGGALRNDEICRQFAREMLFVMNHVKITLKKKNKTNSVSSGLAQ